MAMIGMQPGSIQSFQILASSIVLVPPKPLVCPTNRSAVVNLLFAAHKRPVEGTLTFYERPTFETPKAAHRANSLLFSLIHATKSFLDAYADGAQEIRNELKQKPRDATKGESEEEEHVLEDVRFDEHGA